jgi:hypothetical protein
VTQQAKLAAAALGGAIALAGGIAAVTLIESDGAATTATVDCTVATTPCVGDTLAADPKTMAVPQQSVTMLVKAKILLRRTSISGKTYHANDQKYKGSNWWKAISALLVGQAAAPVELRPAVDGIGNKLVATKVSGRTYFARPLVYRGGHWDKAVKGLNSLITKVKGSATNPPTITILKGNG